MRRLSALIGGLPPDSALHRQGGMWTPDQELAAIRIERGELWGRTIVAMWAGKGARLPDAIGIGHPDRRTPDPPPRRKPTSDPAEIAGFLAHLGRR